MSNTATTPWWQGTNFYIAAIMASLGVSFGIQEQEVGALVTPVFAIISAAGLIRERIKAATPNWGEWIKSKNTWNYLTAAIIQIVPNLPAGLGEKIFEVVQAVIGKNWTATITGIISVATIIYFWLFAPKRTAVATDTISN